MTDVPTGDPIQPGIVDRARGCLMGQLAGDALGSQVEFLPPTTIRQRFPDCVRDLQDGGTHNTIAGQPTDDSEMALLLARMLIRENTYCAEHAFTQYRSWYDSNPFDCGNTIASALNGSLNHSSQANGALMRISPLGIFGTRAERDCLIAWAREDACLTHPHPVCQEANALFCVALSYAIQHQTTHVKLYECLLDLARELQVATSLLNAIQNAQHRKPDDYVNQQGWVLIAFQNALWQLLHAPDAESALIDTVMLGGDTDTNAAICGALLGAVYGLQSIPQRWVATVLNCRPAANRPEVHNPRPESMWPCDALDLADQLLGIPSASTHGSTEG